MNGFMKNGAVVEPAALKKMQADIDQLAVRLNKTSNEIINKTQRLNQSGFKDAHFQQLNTVIHQNKENLKKLEEEMKKFSLYLKDKEQIVKKYVDGPKMPKSQITI